MDLEQLRSRGYTVVEQVVTTAHVDAALQALRDVTGVDVGDRSTWDVRDPGALPIWGHQAQWDIRQHPPLHAAFAAAYGEDALWVHQDGIGVKPPLSVAATEAAAARAIHWDMVPTEPRRVYQGVLYLTDASIEGGAFCCVPGLFTDLDGWLERHPDAELEDIDLEAHEIVAVPGRAGDLVLFDARLPHGTLANNAAAARAVQYVMMTPPGFYGERAADHIAIWRTGRANPAFRSRPGWDLPALGPPAQLSELGRRLVGLDAW